MTKGVFAGGLLVLVAALALVLAPRVQAQRPGRVTAAPFLTLEGLGSSIGLVVRDADAEEARRTGTSGVVIQDVREGTPAAKAGLRDADIVVEFDGERVRSTRQFTRLVRETAPGRVVKMTVVRGGSRQTVDIAPEARGSFDVDFPDIAADVQREWRALPPDFAFNFDFAPGVGPFAPRRLGLTVVQLSPQLLTYFGVKQGVLVSTVAADSPAEAAGIKAGDVITTINGRAVSDASDVTAAVRDADAGASLDVRVTRERRELTLTPKMPERSRPVAARGRGV